MLYNHIVDRFGLSTTYPIQRYTHADRAVLVNLMAHRKILVFREQRLTADDLVRFSSIFGELWRNDDNSTLGGNGESHSSHEDNRLITLVGNFKGGVLGSHPVPWHGDLGHKPARSRGGTLPFRILYGHEIPSEGTAPTFWIDTEELYERLPEHIKEIIHGANGIYNAPYPTNWHDARRPTVLTDPRTGKLSANTDLLFLTGIEGMDEADFQAFRREVKASIDQCRQYEHKWCEGDLVLYNNFNTLHYRPEVTNPKRRVLWRTTFQIFELIPNELRDASIISSSV